MLLFHLCVCVIYLQALQISIQVFSTHISNYYCISYTYLEIWTRDLWNSESCVFPLGHERERFVIEYLWSLTLEAKQKELSHLRQMIYDL